MRVVVAKKNGDVVCFVNPVMFSLKRVRGQFVCSFDVGDGYIEYSISEDSWKRARSDLVSGAEVIGVREV